MGWGRGEGAVGEGGQSGRTVPLARPPPLPTPHPFRPFTCRPARGQGRYEDARGRPNAKGQQGEGEEQCGPQAQRARAWGVRCPGPWGQFAEIDQHPHGLTTWYGRRWGWVAGGRGGLVGPARAGKEACRPAAAARVPPPAWARGAKKSWPRMLYSSLAHLRGGGGAGGQGALSGRGGRCEEAGAAAGRQPRRAVVPPTSAASPGTSSNASLLSHHRRGKNLSPRASVPARPA